MTRQKNATPELDPYIFLDENDVSWDVSSKCSQDSVHHFSNDSSPPRTVNTGKQIVLLGFYESDSGPVRNMLESTKISPSVEVLQSRDELLYFAEHNHPSVIMLDNRLFGCTGLEFCKVIRNEMGDWGKNVPILVIACPGEGERARVTV